MYAENMQNETTSNIESITATTFTNDNMFKFVYDNNITAIKEYLPTYCTEYNSLKQTPLMYACLLGNIDAAKLLLQDIGKIDLNGKISLFYAIKSGNEEVINYIKQYEYNEYVHKILVPPI